MSEENGKKKRGRPRKKPIETGIKKAGRKKNKVVVDKSIVVKCDNPEAKYEKYWNEFTPEIKAAPDTIKDMYVDYINLQNEGQYHPEKIMYINGEPLDCAASLVIVRKKVLELGGTSVDYNEAMRRYKLIKAISNKKTSVTMRYKNALQKLNNGNFNPVLIDKGSEILEMFGEHRNLNEVHDVINNDWDLGVTKPELRSFMKSNSERITELRNKYILKKKDFNLATDTGRLETLSKLLHTWTKKFEEKQSVDVSREIRGVIEQARKEVKGDELKLTIDGKIDVQATQMARETIDSVLSRLPINLMIIGIVAAKGNVNPAEIIASLTSSYYNGLNGFSKLDTGIQPPSIQKYIQAYNWEELKETISEQKPPQTLASYEEDIQDAEIIEEKKNSALDLINQFRENNKNISKI